MARKHKRRSGRIARELRGLTQSEEGYWRYQGTDAEGNRTRVSLGRVSKEEAIAMRDELLAGTGGIVDQRHGEPTRFAELAVRYLEGSASLRESLVLCGLLDPGLGDRVDAILVRHQG